MGGGIGVHGEPTLRSMEALLESSKELRDKGNFKQSLINIGELIRLSFGLILSMLGIDAPNDSLLSLYHLIPIEIRPPIGERELEYFEQRCGFLLGSERSLDPESLEIGLDIAEKVFYWTKSLIESKFRDL